MKIVVVIVVMDVDVFGLVEIENDGYGSDFVIVFFVNSVNVEFGSDVYSYVVFELLFGGDEIVVGIIYKFVMVIL